MSFEQTIFKPDSFSTTCKERLLQLREIGRESILRKPIQSWPGVSLTVQWGSGMLCELLDKEMD